MAAATRLLAPHGWIGGLGTTSLHVGLAEVAAGRPHDAEAHLRAAIATSARNCLRPSLARARLAPAAGGAASVEAKAALRLAEEVGMRLVARAAGVLAEA